MKKIEIYKENELKMAILIDKYDIITYPNSFDINCKIEDMEVTYNIPVNKGYKIMIEI